VCTRIEGIGKHRRFAAPGPLAGNRSRRDHDCPGVSARDPAHREDCEEIPVKVRIIPGLYEILDGSVEISRIRDVQIEDLLGRAPVQLDVESISRELAGKIVMVTGAALDWVGVSQAGNTFFAAKLLLVERAEFALFNIDRALKEVALPCLLCPWLRISATCPGCASSSNPIDRKL